MFTRRFFSYLMTLFLVFMPLTPIMAQTASSEAAGQNSASVTVINTSSTTLNNSDLNIPLGSTVIIDFSNGGTFSTNGNLQNAGSLYGISSNPAINGVTISGNNIYNQSGALISTILPGNLQGLPYDLSQLVSNLSLSLTAINNIVNYGIISSAGNLNLTAGGSITNAIPAGSSLAASSALLSAINNVNLSALNIMNSGAIASQLGTITAATATMTNAGVIEALQGTVRITNLLDSMSGPSSLSVINNMGAIKARDSIIFNLLAEIDNCSPSVSVLSLEGGSLAAPALEFINPSGDLWVNAESLSGLLSLTGKSAAVNASKSNLELGAMNLTGIDPIYSSTADLVLSPAAINSMSSGMDYVFLAGRDIRASNSSSATLDLRNSNSANGSIVAAAGVRYAVYGPASYEILGPSSTGGDINLPNISFISNTGKDISLEAHAGTANSGYVSVRDLTAGAVKANTYTGSIVVNADSYISIDDISTNGRNGNNGSWLSAAQDGTGAGNIWLTAGTSITVDDVDAIGGAGGNGTLSIIGATDGANGGRGGGFHANAGDDIVIDRITVSGGNGGEAGDSLLYGGSGGHGGDAGSFTVVAGSDIDLTGPLLAAGGRGGDAEFGLLESGTGGNGGRAGALTFRAEDDISVESALSPGGRGGDAYRLAGTGGDGEYIAMMAEDEIRISDSIGSSGGNGGNSYAGTGGNAGNSAHIALYAENNIEKTGSQLANVFAIGGIGGAGDDGPGLGGDGGALEIRAYNGSIDTKELTYASTGYGQGKSAGSIELSARNYIDAAQIDAAGEAGARGGNINLTSDLLTVRTRENGISIDSSSYPLAGEAAAEAGNITIVTKGNSALVIGSSSGSNYVRGSIAANGEDGGIVELRNQGGQYLVAGAYIKANGTSGNGGSIKFALFDNTGFDPETARIEGLFEATNDAGNSGRIGFHSGSGLDLNVPGAGQVRAGEWIAFGNLTKDLDLAKDKAGYLSPFPPDLNIIGDTRCNCINCHPEPEPQVVLSKTTPNQPPILSPSEPVRLSMPTVYTASTILPVDTLSLNCYLDKERAFPPQETDSKTASKDEFSPRAIQDPIVSLKPEYHKYSIPGAVVRTAGNCDFELTGKNSTCLKTGEALFQTMETLRIETPICPVVIKENSLVLVSVSGRLLKVRTLRDPSVDSVRVFLDNQEIEVPIGSELVIAPEEAAILSDLSSDRLGRRRFKVAKVSDRWVVATSEISAVTIISRNELMNALYKSSDKHDKRTMRQILHTAASVHVVTGNHGRFEGKISYGYAWTK